MDPSPKRCHQSNDRNGRIEANCSKLHLQLKLNRQVKSPGKDIYVCFFKWAWEHGLWTLGDWDKNNQVLLGFQHLINHLIQIAELKSENLLPEQVCPLVALVPGFHVFTICIHLPFKTQWSSWRYLHDGQHQQSRQGSEHHKNHGQGDNLQRWREMERASFKRITPSTYGCWTKNRVILPPKWMVKIMETPMNKWMIWGAHPYFWKHPYTSETKHLWDQHRAVKGGCGSFNQRLHLGCKGSHEACYSYPPAPLQRQLWTCQLYIILHPLCSVLNHRIIDHKT